jgi:hypothetical protein
MAATKDLTDERIRRRRVAEQLLHRPARSSPAALVRRLTGVQAQVLTAAGLALRARTEGLTEARVDRARVRDRSIVLTWAMRGTLHLIPAEDVRWLIPLTTEPGISNAMRRLRQEGLAAADVERAGRIVARVLERQGPMLRRELAERLRARGIRAEGQAMAHLMWLAAAEGVACHGPDRDGDKAFVLVRDWLGEPERIDREAALAELAVRYLRAHAPATPADLVAWSGIRAGDAGRAWLSIEDRLVDVPTRRGTMWALRSSRASEPAGVVRLLPAFDEFLLGWKDRGPTAAPADWRRINRGGGWLHPVVLADGRAVGTWRWAGDRAGSTVDVRPFRRLPTGARDAIRAEARDIAGFRDRAPRG